jgi:hypothetical protein
MLNLPLPTCWICARNTSRTSSPNRPRYFTFGGTSINLDLGTIFAKGREHFLKENSEAKVDLIDDENNNNTPYSPGHTVKGEAIILLPPNEEEEDKKKIRGMKITLSGIEYAFAQGYKG